MFGNYDDDKRFMDDVAEGYYFWQIDKERRKNDYDKLLGKLLTDEEARIRVEEEEKIRREHPDWSDVEVYQKLNEIVRKRLVEYEMQL